MSLNCNEINLILDELDLTGGFVQDVTQNGFDSLALFVYKPGRSKTVFVSLTQNACRICEVKRKIPKNEKPLRFNELLRSRLKGARVSSCEQIGMERIIQIKTVRTGSIYVMPAAQERIHSKKKSANRQKELRQEAADDGASAREELSLFVRLWSGAANIFLCDKDNVIIDCFYRRPAKGEVSGAKLILPLADKQSAEKAKADYPARDFEKLFALKGKIFKASASFESGKAKPLSFNEQVDLYYTTLAQDSQAEVLLEQAERWYNAKKSRLEGALDRLIEKRDDFKNAEQWKHQGDLILTFAHLFPSRALKSKSSLRQEGESIQPQSAESNRQYLECEDYESGKTVRIKIDPFKSAQENAALFYETYKKQSGALESLEHDIAQTQKTISELDKTYAKMREERNPLKLEQFLRKAKKPKQQDKKEPGLRYEINGWSLLVGRDAGENDELLRRYAKGSDTWMHTRDCAGGYVFIKNRAGKTVPLDILLYAGNLAVYYSKARKNAAADLYYTQVKHLRRAKNAPKGTVIPTNEKNIHIKLDEAKLRYLDDLNRELLTP